ncbi:low affinity iron permease family protein [Sphingobium agri]|uniref:Low affinity iron permease family protein n=1 Tax=Sphingobium agri TaxID=2933566 RepID=A0ABT0DU18_9SPHN|nr:low affinity iron permease family protein [Sphingobium agri]MCK0530554.1 low affinity iron permease family protein [Sphingobium agri]
MDRIFTALATRIASAAGQPLSFVLAFGLILVWGVSGPLFGYSDTWQLVINTGTTIVTFLVVFLIQNSQNRDAAAMQAKLDEVIRALDSAREQFIGIEHRSAGEVEQIRAALEKEVGCDEGKAGTADDSVEHVLRRT